MSNRLILPSICSAFFLAAITLHAEPATAPATSLAGNWKWELQVQDNPIPWTATFTKDGDNYTGSAVDGYDDSKMDLKNIKVVGDKVSFTCERTGDFEIHFDYSGQLSDEGIIGTAKIKFSDQDPQSMEFKAKRVATPTTMPATMPAKM